METKGWNFKKATELATDQCEGAAWAGHNNNDPSSVSATFKGYGTLKLSVKNCSNRGYVTVYINKSIKGTLNSGDTIEKILSYKKDDILKITESLGIIQINYMSLSCAGKH